MGLIFVLAAACLCVTAWLTPASAVQYDVCQGNAGDSIATGPSKQDTLIGGTDARDCTKLVTAPPGSQIKVVFGKMVARNTFDCLRVYEGVAWPNFATTRTDSSNPRLLAMYCGPRSPTDAAEPLQSSSNVLLFRWTHGTATATTTHGFELAWDTITKGQTDVALNYPPTYANYRRGTYSTAPTVCGGTTILTTSTGTLTDRVLGDHPLSGTKCTRAVQGPPGSLAVVKVVSYSLAGASSAGYLKIYRGTETSGRDATLDQPVAGTYKGNTNGMAVGVVYTLPTNTFTVSWNGYKCPTNAGSTRTCDFTLSWTFTTTTANVCLATGTGSVLTFDNGVLIDNSAAGVDATGRLVPQRIDVNADGCMKTITAPKGKQVVVEFVRLQLRAAYDCLEVYDSAAPDVKDKTHMLAEYCGPRQSGTSVPQNIRSEGNSLTLRWDHKTSSQYVYTGFELKWQFVDAPPAKGADTVCYGGVLTAATGVLADRMVTSGRDRVTLGGRCARAIRGPPHTVVRIEIEYLDIPYSSSTSPSTMEIFRGTDTASLADSTTRRDPAVTFQSPGKVAGTVEVLPSSAVVVRWTAQKNIPTNPRQGFKLKWSFLPKTVNICREDQPRNMTWDNGILQDDSSTTGPVNDKAVDCRKTIIAPPGHRIQITFVRFEASPNRVYDCLEAYELAAIAADVKTKTRMLAEWCGGTFQGRAYKPQTFLTDGNALTFRWDHVASTTYTGFELKWSFVKLVKHASGGAGPAVATVCGGGGPLTAPVGTLVDRVTTPGNDLSLPGQRCRRTIQGPPGTSVQIKFGKKIEIGYVLLFNLLVCVRRDCG